MLKNFGTSKLKIQKKKLLATIALALMLTIVAPYMNFLPKVNAQVVDNITTVAFLSFRPNPIGVGQTLLINVWLSPSLPAPDVYKDYTVTITKPDGTTDIINFPQAFVDQTQWTTYVPDKVGNWTIQFSFPGQSMNASGTQYPNPRVYSPASTQKQTLVVQEAQIPSYVEAPLPNDFWARPINRNNRDWVSIGGNWLMDRYDASQASFNPYTTAPNSAHIVWDKQIALGGFVGGSDYGGNTFGGELSATVPTAIMAGRAYSNSPDGIHCTDIRTGQELWFDPGASFTFANPEILPYINQPEPTLDKLTSSTLIKYSAFDGRIVCNVTGLSGTYCGQIYVYSVQTKGSNHWLVKWSTVGTSNNFTSRIIYNVTYPFNGITYMQPDVGVYHAGTTLNASWGAFDTTTGAILWNRPLAESEYRYSGGCLAYGKLFLPLYYPDPTLRIRQYACWDVYTGKLLYKTGATEYPWGDFLPYHTAAAYNNFYTMSYDGYIYAYDANTGKLVWKSGAHPSGFESAQPNQPYFAFTYGNTLADGKLYITNGEHDVAYPLPRGWRLRCFDANNGKELWNVSFTGYSDMGPILIADGYLLMSNAYDAKLYSFGKGQTKTEVSAPQTAITQGQSVLITGTVTDQSPGAPGTPCVSEESMSAWMDYLYMQQPIPTNVTGVSVKLAAIDPNGTTQDIGTVTSDVNGLFMKMWTPSTPGEYKIIASFEGSESYWRSHGETGLGVTPAPAPAAAPLTIDTVNNSVMTFTAVATLAIIIAIAIATIFIVRTRKRQ